MNKRENDYRCETASQFIEDMQWISVNQQLVSILSNELCRNIRITNLRMTSHEKPKNHPIIDH